MFVSRISVKRKGRGGVCVRKRGKKRNAETAPYSLTAHTLNHSHTLHHTMCTIRAHVVDSVTRTGKQRTFWTMPTHVP